MSNKRFAALVIAGWFAFVALGAFVGYGIDSNVPNVQTANYQIAASDCTKTVLMGTGATGQLTVTLPAVAGFPSNCSVLVKNGDSASGKILSGFPSSLGTILYPHQSVGLKIVNRAWHPFYSPGPWVPAAGNAGLFASPSGVDTNDCLSAGTACTLKHACLVRQNIFYSATITITLATGSYSSVDGNNALCSILGNNGGTSPTLTSLVGAGGTYPTSVVFAIPANGVGVYIKDGGEASISGIEFTGGNGSIGIENSGQGAVADYTNVTWGAWGTSGVHVSLTDGSYVNLGALGESIIANFTSSFHWIVSGGRLFAGGPTTINSAVSWTGGQFLSAGPNNPVVELGGWSTAGAGVSGSTGQKASLAGNGYMGTRASAKCNAALPGDANSCSISPGFQTGGSDASTVPALASTTTFANLGTPAAGMYAYITDGKASNCGDTTCTTFGTAVTGGGGALPLFIWYTGAAWHLVGK
jgi:hypothetical protein